MKKNRSVYAELDPVGAGFVESLARPGGNITGFSNMATHSMVEVEDLQSGDVTAAAQKLG